MVNFSCFSIPPVNRSKKTVQASVQKLPAYNQSVAGDQSIKLAIGSARANPMLDINNSSCYMVEQNISPCSQGDCWKSDDLNVNLPEDSKEILQTERIKKSRSLGNMLEKGSHFYGDGYTEDDYIDHGFSFHQVNGWNMKGIKESSNNAISTEIFHQENVGENYHNQKKENVSINSFDLLTETMHHESVFSVEVLKHYGRDTSATRQKDESGPSGNISMMARSYSVTNLRAKMDESSVSDTSHQLVLRRSRSFSDLNNFNGLETELLNGAKSFDSGVTIEKNIIVSCSNGKPHPSVNGEEGHLSLVRGNRVRAHDSDGKYLSVKFDLDDKAARNFQCNVNFADDYRKSEANDAEIRKSCLQESSQKNWEQLTPEEFSKMRVEHWISQIDICSDLIVEEQGESSTHVSKDDPKSLATVDSPKPDTRSSLAMEVAYNYISSLNASSSSAQMANLGLVSVPVLTLFVGLRVVNLSGNAIVKVTPGSLPKGLHMLNLSKNNISTIEGLRVLSHLRVLDLSYNRITRIGHGLASCSSLKELYLAGNKISEVEGLHRLLKLHILDLQNNKISTAKGLGQLAANYGSLQAINLEGNPAQRNVGDGQLRKFLLGLLPNLVYYNKQAIRMGSKEVSDRTTRAIPSPQFERGIRAEHKVPRRGSLGSGHHQLASSNAWQNPAMATSAKLSKDRHVRLLLPPDASKLANPNLDTGKKLLSTNDAEKRNRSTEALLRCYFKS